MLVFWCCGGCCFDLGFFFLVVCGGFFCFIWGSLLLFWGLFMRLRIFVFDFFGWLFGLVFCMARNRINVTCAQYF